ncbi:MAG: hypothetical protein GC151_06660 [Betaproteobacteria bacterium]|nr:hypothetical protein [Betaproteobacteria bacterium]
MKNGRLAPLYLPGALLLLSLLVGSISVYYAESRVSLADRTLQTRQRDLSAAMRKHANAGLEKDILKRFMGTYASLEKVGFVGAEQRINWIDSLRVANQEAGLFGVEYQIGQQEPFIWGAELGLDNLHMRQSLMTVKVPLLHEGDLMRFFRLLAAQRAGVFLMHSCTLSRLGQDGMHGAHANILAECDLFWITVPETESEGRTQ